MDTKALKDKILQLAIQGKLVPQDENDEPASVLLEKIEAEKERLIKDKVIKKEKSLQEISEEEKLFDLPNGWEWCRLGDISNIIMGQSPDSKTISENKCGIEFHQGKASFGKFLIRESGLYCTKPNKIAIAGDILLSVRAPVGTLNITNRELCIGRGLTAIRRFIDIENKFLYYFIMGLEDELVNKATGTTFLAVASSIIKEFLIPLPPLEEQKRIVIKLDILFKLIDELDNNKQDLLQNISDTRNKVLQLAIQGKLVDQNEDDEPASVLLENIKEEKERLIKEKVIKKEKPLPEISEEEKLFDLPNGWEWARLGNLGNIFNGNSINAKLKESKYSNIKEGYNYIATKDIDLKSRIINYENGIKIPFNEEKFRIAHKGAVLICAEGASAGKKIGLVKEDICFGNKLLAIELFYKTNSKYLFYLYQSTEFSKIFSNLISGIVGGISSKNFKEISIPLPPLEEQKRIVAKVDTIMNYLDELEKQINQ